MNYIMQERENESHVPAPVRQEHERKSPGVHKPNALPWAAMACSVAALCLSIGALVITLPKDEPEPIEAPEPAVEAYSPEEYITYKEHQLPLEEELAVSAWDHTGFTVDESGWLSYESGGVTALRGIDVSSHQGEIDWKAVAKSGVDFAMIRAGYRGYGEEGRLLSDERFHQNMKGALEAGLDVGVYFFSQAINVWEAEEEARLVLESLAEYEVRFPVVFDWERISGGNARTDEVAGKSIALMARAFCGLVKQAGYTPGVYFNQNLGYLSLDLAELDGCVFWLAEYDQRPDFYYHADLWQYSSTGTVPGIDTPVDLNLSYRDFGAAQTADAP